MSFELQGLVDDTFQVNTFVSYSLEVLVTITGSRVSPDIGQFGTEHFDWAYVLSTDAVWDKPVTDRYGVITGDYLSERAPLEPGQVTVMQVSGQSRVHACLSHAIRCLCFRGSNSSWRLVFFVIFLGIFWVVKCLFM